jgi:PAS domain S-box-containing protein
LLRAAVKGVLEKDGCVVRVLQSDEALVQAVKDETIDLSIVSLSAMQEPHITRLLELHDMITPPSVILLVLPDQQRPEACADYLVKPFSKRELLLSVRSRLQLICLRKVLDRNEDQLSAAHRALEKTREELENSMRQLSGEAVMQNKVLRELRVGIHVVDADMRIVRWNGAMSNIVGAEKTKGADGKLLSSVFAPLRKKDIAKQYRDAFDRGKERTISPVVFKGKDGKEKQISIHLFPLAPRKRANAQMLCIVKPAKQAKQKGEKLLGQERKEAVMQTAVTFNHEINNPLTTILTNTQLLLEETEQLDRKIVGRLKRIEEESRRIKRVTETLSSLSNPAATDYPGGLKMIKLPG